MSPSCRALQGAEYQLRLSLFDATYHHFFGRTWRSSRRAARATPPRPARAAFNEVGCWGSGRAGCVWENTGSPPGRGSDPTGRRLELQESSRRREVFNTRREKLSLLEFSLELLSFGAGLAPSVCGSGAWRALGAYDRHAVAVSLLKRQVRSVPRLWPVVSLSAAEPRLRGFVLLHAGRQQQQTLFPSRSFAQGAPQTQPTS